MPLYSEDGKVFDNEIDVHLGIEIKPKGMPVIDPSGKTEDKNEISPEAIPTPKDLSNLQFSAQRRTGDLSPTAPQNPPVGHTEARTDVLQGPEVSGYTPESSQTQTGFPNPVNVFVDMLEENKKTGTKMWEEFKGNFDKIGAFLSGDISKEELINSGAVMKLAADLATGGIVTAPARSGTAGIFGGRLGAAKASEKVLNVERLDSALAHLEKNMPANEVYNKTGWWKDVRDNQWKFEIDDSKAVLKTEKITEDFAKPLEEVFKHNDLYKAYPELKDVAIIYEPSLSSIAAFGKPNPKGFKEGIIVVGPKWRKMPEEDQLGSILHELQHAVQTKEGFAPGSWYDNATVQSLRKVEQDLNETRLNLALKTIDKGVGSLTKGEKKILQISSEGAEAAVLKARKIWDDYYNTPGEIEARNVDARNKIRKLGLDPGHPLGTEGIDPLKILEK